MQRPTDTIDVVDPTGAIYTAIYGNLNIVVMDFEAPAVEPVATGTWTDVYYSELDDYTVFEDTSASFSTTVSVGDLIQPDTAQPSVWLTVSSVLSNTELTVSGDKTATSAPLLPYIVTDPIWSYSSGVSTYTNGSANFESWMLGWLFTPDVNEPCYLQIIEVTSATSIKVKGDARGLSEPDDQWRIHAPPGVDNTTGGLHTDLTEAGSRYLYGSMRYMPPQVGFDVSGDIHGTQSGVMLSGCYFDGILVDPQSGVAFQDAGSDNNSGTPIKSSGRWILEGKDSDDFGHDRPGGGVRIRWIKDDCDCSMRLMLETSGHESGNSPVRDAVIERIDWVYKNMEEAQPNAADEPEPPPFKQGLGKWNFYRKKSNGKNEYDLVGHAFALAIIIMYDCQCELKMPRWSQQELQGGSTWVDDNYGSKEGKNNNADKMKEAKVTKNFDGTPRDYCYQVWVDSVGSVRSSIKPDFERNIHKAFRGYAIVKHRARDDCWARGLAFWQVRTSIGPNQIRTPLSKKALPGMVTAGGVHNWMSFVTHHKTDPGRPWQ